MLADPLNAVLVRRRDVTESLSVVWVRPESGITPAFQPGQFVRLGLPKPQPAAAGNPGRIRLTRRAYSIASAADTADALEFFVVRVEQGQLTPRLWDLDPGARLWMDSEAKGEFTLELAPVGVDLVMVATGTGVAPFVSMLRTHCPPRAWRRFVLIHGARYGRDLGYDEELTVIARRDPTVIYIPLTTREPAEGAWSGLRGRVQTALEPENYRRLVGAELDPGACHVFLCGNPDMIDETQRRLTGRGFRADSPQGRGNLHFERYW
jgi:ferredoxin--NADP+ reductase